MLREIPTPLASLYPRRNMLLNNIYVNDLNLLLTPRLISQQAGQPTTTAPNPEDHNTSSTLKISQSLGEPRIKQPMKEIESSRLGLQNSMKKNFWPRGSPGQHSDEDGSTYFFIAPGDPNILRPKISRPNNPLSNCPALWFRIKCTGHQLASMLSVLSL